MTSQPTVTALTATTDRRLIRANGRSRRFVLAEITAPAAERRPERLPVNLAFILDRSGSMSGEKIALAKQTITTALGYLGERDRFSVIAFDDVVDVVVESTPASAAARKDAAERIARIDARRSTNLSEGWFRGAEQVAAHLAQEGVNRCLLMTDGLANHGVTDPDELARHAAELRARGVSVTTFGIGADFDEVLLQSLADAGGGHFYFVRDAATIQDHLQARSARPSRSSPATPSSRSWLPRTSSSRRSRPRPRTGAAPGPSCSSVTWSASRSSTSSSG